MIMCAVRTVIAQPELVSQQILDWKNEGRLAADAPAGLDWVVQNGVGSVTAAAYKFAAEPAGVSSVLCGTGSIAHLEDNVTAVLGKPLPAEVSRRLRELFVPVAQNVGHGSRG
jgi:L-galactose dehydrogenase